MGRQLNEIINILKANQTLANEKGLIPDMEHFAQELLRLKEKLYWSQGSFHGLFNYAYCVAWECVNINVRLFKLLESSHYDISMRLGVDLSEWGDFIFEETEHVEWIPFNLQSKEDIDRKIGNVRDSWKIFLEKQRQADLPKDILDMLHVASDLDEKHDENSKVLEFVAELKDFMVCLSYAFIGIENNRENEADKIWGHWVANKDISSMFESKKRHFENHIKEEPNKIDFVNQCITRVEEELEHTETFGARWLASEDDKTELTRKLIALPQSYFRKEAIDKLYRFIVDVLFLDWLNERKDELSKPQDEEIRGNANKANTKKTTVAIFAKKISDPSKVDAVLTKLHELVDRQTDPKEIVMPIRAAMDAGVLGRPTWGEFQEEFGEEKIKSKSSFTDYTNKNYGYEGENFLKMIEDFKKI